MPTLSALVIGVPRRRLAFNSPWAAIAILVAAQLALTLFVSPARDYPVEDDWAYAQVVQSILQGHLQLSEFAGPSTVFHATWGALWCAVFGFSFTTLTVANLVMGVLAALVFWALLRELGFSMVLSLLGALTLLLNPITTFLSYTFMTDITFVAMLLAALWAFTVACHRPQPLGYLLLSGVFSAAAVLTRQIGFAAPLAIGIAWIGYHGLRRGAVGAALAVVPPVIAYGLLLTWINTHGGPPWAWGLYGPGTVLATVVSPRALMIRVVRFFYVAGFLTFLLLPIFALLLTTLGRLRGRTSIADCTAPTDGPVKAAQGPPQNRRALRYIAAGVALVVVYGAFYAAGGSFNGGSDILRSQGYWPTLSGLADKLPVFPPAFWVALTIVIVPLVAALLTLLCWTLADALRRRRSHDPALTGIALAMLVILGLTMVVEFYHDSLALPMLPGLIIFLLAWVRGRAVRVGPAVAVLLLFAAFSLFSLRDLHNWHATAWRAGQALLTAGVPLTHISGGNEWNYWYLGEEEIRQSRAAGRSIAFGVHMIQPEYVLSFTPQITWIVDAPFPQNGPPYRVCAQLPYERPLHPTPAFVYILTNGGCPPGLDARAR